MPNFTGLWTANQQFQAVGGSTWPSFPGAPTSAVATATSGTAASVAFTAPSSTGYPASITGYIVTSSPGGLTGTGASSPISVTGLTTDTAYTFTVRAINATGTGPSSAASNSVTPVNAFVEDLFSTYTYTGNGSTQTITNGIDLSTKGGLVWIKDRSSGQSHALSDTARGVGSSKQLRSNTTGAATTDTFTGFTTTGFTLDASFGAGAQNLSAVTYVSWTFRKEPKFFDIVTYTGTGTTAQNISHNLGAVPGCIIIKRTDSTSDWGVVHRSTNAYANYGYIGGKLNTTGIVGQTVSEDTGIYYTNSTTFQVDEGSAYFNPNASGGTYVAYLFAHDAGGFGLTGTDNVISCGSYTGSSSSVSINLGYEAQWIMVKNTSRTGTNWQILDIMRGMPLRGNAPTLYPDLSDAESALTAPVIVPTATGVTITGGLGYTINYNGDSYIYIAIRRPMKVPTLGTSVFIPQTRSGTSSAATVTGVGFAPDLTIFNTRNRAALAWNFPFCDRLRGPQRQIHSNTAAAEAINDYGLLAYTMDGMSLGNDGTDSGINYSTSTYVNYFFKRAPGFFDEVCYTGTGTSGATQAHNLTVTPELMIIKGRSSVENWGVWCSYTPTKEIYLNLAGSYGSGNTATASATTITLQGMGGTSAINASGQTYVAYLFATCPGVSKVGSYTGNGTTQTIDCGFTGGARFVLIKRTDDTGGWYVYDTARGMTSGTDPYSLLNAHTYVTGNQEVDTLGSVTTVSTGFALNSAVLAAININAGTYIFLAIA